MSRQQCEHCGTSYGHLQRAAENELFICKDCGRESCARCAEREPSGPLVWFLRCPNCSGASLDRLNLKERFSIYASVGDLTTARFTIAMLFVPWSVYPKRNESIIIETMPLLQMFDPAFVLLDEDDSAIRQTVSGWFPSLCNPDVAAGNGAVIWLREGQPIEYLRGGPYLAKLEILNQSRKAWSGGMARESVG